MNTTDLDTVEITTEKVDRIGIGLSAVCAIHCLVTPLIFIAAPWLEGYVEHGLFHIIMLTFVLPVGLFAFISQFRKHHDFKILSIGLIGLLFVTLGVIIPEFLGHTQIGELLESSFSICGSIALLTGHYLNLKSRTCSNC
ncbi:MAG: MerC domain-containing protein [Halobacteriovoraceae bacterium]|nr:MerC domain-containing protein [Halobacteriovoraceae bacterium]